LRYVLKLTELPLKENKKAELLLKAKKNFLKECVRSIRDTRKIKPALQAFKLSQMNFKDVLSGILNKSL
jgi:hypothetical protein